MKNDFDNIFKLEQSILQCWNVIEDIKLLSDQAIERETALTPDDWANILNGMELLYQLKFEKCFNDFENVCADYRKQSQLHKTTHSEEDNFV
jgi:hypothetical protein